MTATAITVSDVARRYGSKFALRDVTFEVPTGTIVGLLGRNGAGKTTLMRIIATHEFASSGTVRVFGQNPVQHEAVLQRLAFIREDQIYPGRATRVTLPANFQVRHALRTAQLFSPHWSAPLADTLLHDFDLPLHRSVYQLSRGMRAALGIVMGLAARAELTLFDEPYAGLDPVARRLFYDHLRADQAAHPRTVLLSTHLVDEVAGLLERVVVLDHGRVAVDAAADDLRGAATRITGTGPAVEQFTANRPFWDARRAAAEATAVVSGPLSNQDRAEARALHLALEPVSLQDFIVHLTTPAHERISL